MKKILVYGAGRQGTAVGYALCQLGHKIYLYDLDGDTAMSAAKKIYGLFPECELEVLFGPNCNLVLSSMDAVVSTATYTANLEIAKQCVDSAVPYFDLGGNVGVSEKIQAYAQEANKSPVFTDLGLAPGLVNIMAENLYHDMYDIYENPIGVAMAVGGLPVRDIAPETSGYSIVFSPKGLINEYFDACKTLRNGNITIAAGMSDLAIIPFKNEEIEVFSTSGGAAHSIDRFQKLGVKDVVYKTIRYPGHRDFILRLLQLYPNDSDGFEKKLVELCPPTEQDRVLIIVCVQGETMTITKQLEIKCDENWTAMQIATAFPTAAIVNQYINGEMKTYDRPVLGYEYVNYEALVANLSDLGVEI